MVESGSQLVVSTATDASVLFTEIASPAFVTLTRESSAFFNTFTSSISSSAFFIKSASTSPVWNRARTGWRRWWGRFRAWWSASEFFTERSSPARVADALEVKMTITSLCRNAFTMMIVWVDFASLLVRLHWE